MEIVCLSGDVKSKHLPKHIGPSWIHNKQSPIQRQKNSTHIGKSWIAFLISESTRTSQFLHLFFAIRIPNFGRETTMMFFIHGGSHRYLIWSSFHTQDQTSVVILRQLSLLERHGETWIILLLFKCLIFMNFCS